MRVCSIKDCGKPYLAKGYCIKHYERFRKYGDPNIVKLERHEMTGTPEYRTYMDMRRRCYNFSYDLYHRYGGRGIVVCGRWRYSFNNFLTDMGLKPFPKAQLDRIDNDGNYEPSNCRWVSGAVNTQNASYCKLNVPYVKEIRLLYETGMFSLYDLAKIFKVARPTIGCIVQRKTWRNVC